MRYAAFNALRAITGVSTRSQLHDLLIKLRLLHDVTANEVRIILSWSNQYFYSNSTFFTG